MASRKKLTLADLTAFKTKLDSEVDKNRDYMDMMSILVNETLKLEEKLLKEILTKALMCEPEEKQWQRLYKDEQWQSVGSWGYRISYGYVRLGYITIEISGTKINLKFEPLKSDDLSMAEIRCEIDEKDIESKVASDLCRAQMTLKHSGPYGVFVNDKLKGE